MVGPHSVGIDSVWGALYTGRQAGGTAPSFAGIIPQRGGPGAFAVKASFPVRSTAIVR